MRRRIQRREIATHRRPDQAARRALEDFFHDPKLSRYGQMFEVAARQIGNPKSTPVPPAPTEKPLPFGNADPKQIRADK